MENSQDAVGHELWDYLKGEDASEIVERDDGYFYVATGPEHYFADFENWDLHERKAMRYVKGRVLDIGCAAGRVSLYLQKKGFDGLAVDISPLAIKVCNERGVRNTKVASITQLSSKFGRFDTLIFFCNNFGLFGNPDRAKRLLRRFHGMTGENARIIAESVDPYKTTDPVHLEYHRFNLNRSRLPGQLRIRVRHKKYVTPWFDYLLVSKREMRSLLRNTGWRIERILDSKRAVYIAIICKA